MYALLVFSVLSLLPTCLKAFGTLVKSKHAYRASAYFSMQLVVQFFLCSLVPVGSSSFKIELRDLVSREAISLHLG